jgi:hypothetical protein
MSNSKLFHIKDDKEECSNNNLKVLKRPIMLMFNIQDKEDDEIKEEQKIMLSKQKFDLEVDTTSSSRELENEEDEDDGFKTPTHFDNRIQIPKQCPLAPRKTKPLMKRRKAQCRQLLDVSREVELLFQIKNKTFSSSQQSTKKARRE